MAVPLWPPPLFFVNVADKGFSSSGDPRKAGRFLRRECCKFGACKWKLAELAEFCGLVAKDLEATFQVGLKEFEFLR